ncbi:MAG: hypothetical protein AAGI12_06245 [Pseudomonadota bacterium]
MMQELNTAQPFTQNGAYMRAPDDVMRLSQLGSFFPTRLSFLRLLLRDLAEDDANGIWTDWSMDDAGYGHAVYSVRLDGYVFSLIAHTAALDADDRTDRVIAEAWDACFVLFDGVPNANDIATLRAPALVQEAGRFDDRVLVLSRANKSVRLFDHVVEKLAAGEQPDLDRVATTGYLMRTTAVYGNGKFGIADRSKVARNAGLARPFRLEMLTVYLIREFTFALAEHVASRHAGADCALAGPIKRMLGIGNSTGLGMAPFLVNHPALLNAWVEAREQALARVCAQENAEVAASQAWPDLLDRAGHYLTAWKIPDKDEQERIGRLAQAFETAKPVFTAMVDQPFPFAKIIDHARSVSVDLEELMIALALEPHGPLIDDLADTMSSDSGSILEPSQTLAELCATLDTHYAWCDADVFATPGAMTWYVSEEKSEPRFGVDGPHFSPHHRLPLDTARQVVALRADLEDWLNTSDAGETVAAFLCAHPQHRRVIQRVQLIATYPYGEIRDDLVSHRTRPIDMLRCKLSFFGADGFDPKSDRWTRVRLFAGAPCMDELTGDTADAGFLFPARPDVLAGDCAEQTEDVSNPVPA